MHDVSNEAKGKTCSSFRRSRLNLITQVYILSNLLCEVTLVFNGNIRGEIVPQISCCPSQIEHLGRCPKGRCEKFSATKHNWTICKIIWRQVFLIYTENNCFSPSMVEINKIHKRKSISRECYKPLNDTRTALLKIY